MTAKPWPRKYSEINHPWPKYVCPRCGLVLNDEDYVFLIAEDSTMKIIHEACKPRFRVGERVVGFSGNILRKCWAVEHPEPDAGETKS